MMSHTEYMRSWYREKIQNPHIDRVCIGCQADFKTWNHRIRYCSKQCGIDNNTHQNYITCLQCAAVFRVPNYRRNTAKYCGRSCASKSRTDERAANWQGGKTSAITKLRASSQYKAWRIAVFDRDGYACVHCGDNRGGNLEADHIKPQSLYPELILDVDNGRTLCRACHKKTDTWGRKVFNMRKQFQVARKI